MKLKTLFTLIIFVLFAKFLVAQDAVAPAQPGKGYLLGPGDQITLTVAGEKEYDFVATIDYDGNIEVPFNDKPVVAKCRTERELRVELAEMLTKYLRAPQVGIRTDIRSRPPTTISGEVNNPQQVILARKVTLFELLTIAGGPKEEEAGGLIQVFRPQAPACPNSDEAGRWTVDPGDPTEIPSRTYRIKEVRLGQEDSNPIIYPGDVVVVQRAAPVWITGEVQNSMGIYMKDEGLTLTEAVAKVGGFRREASRKDITIQRKDPATGKRERIVVNYSLISKHQQEDIALKANDIVIVGMEKPGLGQKILDIAIGAAKTSVSSISGALPYRIVY
jgi:polysaccharide export outer membrane protein